MHVDYQFGKGLHSDEIGEIFELLPVAVTIADSHGNLTGANHEAIRLWGLKKGNHPFWRIDDNILLIRKDNSSIPSEEFASLLILKAKGKIENLEIGLVKNGKIIWLNILTGPLSSNSVVVSYVDITEKTENEKKLEQLTGQLQKLIYNRDKFYQIVSHDLRNPFTAIMGCCELLLDDLSRYTTDDIEKYLQIISGSSEQAHNLLENLLKWGRLQAGTYQFKPELVDITFVVAESTNLVENQAKDKNISFTFDFDDAYMAYADKNSIEIVLKNLLSNAIKYSYPGGKITISVKDSDTHTAVIIEDYGVGIEKENLDRLFLIDQKFSTTGTASEKGSGLGLLLCKELINKNKGEIFVESQHGKGSKFTFTVPKQPAV